jgi:hypothetical protein
MQLAVSVTPIADSMTSVFGVCYVLGALLVIVALKLMSARR